MIAGVFDRPLSLKQPGLFITGTDTGVGKTAVTCAIACALRQEGLRVGVCKPIASGCRHDREGLVSEDTEALAHFADCRLPLEAINPVRYAEPLAPAAAVEASGRCVAWGEIADCLERIDREHDVVLVEGVGGVLVPLDESVTVLDLAKTLGYPVLTVAHAGLGTLNHTALTLSALQGDGCRVAGVLLNRYDPDAAHLDPSVGSNAHWITRMNRVAVLAQAPVWKDGAADPAKGALPSEFLDAVAAVDWRRVLKRPT